MDMDLDDIKVEESNNRVKLKRVKKDNKLIKKLIKLNIFFLISFIDNDDEQV